MTRDKSPSGPQASLCQKSRPDVLLRITKRSYPPPVIARNETTKQSSRFDKLKAQSTSYFDDLKEQAFHSYGDQMVDRDTYQKVRSQWQVATMTPGDRVKAFAEAQDVVSRCFAPHVKMPVMQILAEEDYIPEFMYYSTMGRADLVSFTTWNKERFRSRDRLPTMGDLQSQGPAAQEANPKLAGALF